ncbi:hypothetical protein BST97_02860 [Nonlabens spongiae]|uniref:Secretion system C-terminal sorting domain-containing protein n=1 Tax=Nonlabens spongiae TaxID=331648 RepID=A0A1W6MHC9_9FLAO|nr:T9SS sorting signal type C domain-containing protein [Nonlabens spongiae]ARN77024.1 hypothetical protein BST97_02860 [Nonlabens spongiae]
MDEVRLWDYALSQEEILGRMNCEVASDESGLSLYFTFDGGVANENNASMASVVNEVTGNNNGGLMNFALSGTTSNRIDGSPILSGVTNPETPTPISFNYQLNDVAAPLSAIIGAGGTGLNWYTSLTGVSSTAAPTPDTSVIGGQTYWVTSINVNGCESELVPVYVAVTPNVEYGCWQMVDTGATHTLAIAENGSLWSWGTNTNGQLGLNDNTARGTPNLVNSDTDWISIATGSGISFALKSNGTLWSWGLNDVGQLGQGDNVERLVPTQVGSDTNWLSIHKTDNSGFAIKSDHSLWVTGSNSNGKLGLGDTNNRNSFTQVGTSTDWAQASGNTHGSLAIKTNGTLWTAGSATYSSSDSNSSFSQIGTDTNWQKIAFGNINAFALKNNGDLYSAGLSLPFGGLGRSHTTGSGFAKVLGGGYKDVMSGGLGATAAIKYDGSLWTWGMIARSGISSTGQPYEPIQVGTDLNWDSITGASGSFIIKKTDNSIWKRGNNSNGHLGSSSPDPSTPTKIACPCDTTTTWDSGAWTNGTPDTTKNAIFLSDYTGTGFSSCSVNVSNSANVVISTGEVLFVENAVTVESGASLEFQNDAYLFQGNDAVNSGEIIMNVESAPMVRQEYTGWGSPVAGQNLQAFSPQTLSNRFYTYDPAGTTAATAWNAVADPSTTSFANSTGYLIRVANNWSSTTPSPYQGVFTGVPNNGSYTILGSAGYNLLGNPYPSPIDAVQFIDANVARGIGALYYWTHEAAQDGSYTAQSNYASFSKAGGVAAAAGGTAPVRVIQTGQGFFADIASAGYIDFNNSLRRIQGDNSLFKSNTSPVPPNDKHRIWLNLTNSTSSFNQIMIAYMDNATNDFDLGIDAKVLTNSPSYLSSLTNNEELVIQGRAAFNINDEVELSITVDTADTYEISAAQFDGIFLSQQFYLWDKQLKVIHDIKNSSYTFQMSPGTYNSRFAIIYQNTTLGINTTEMDPTTVFVNTLNEIVVQNRNISLDKVEVFDIAGKLLYAKSAINDHTHKVTIDLSSAVYLVRTTTTENHSNITKIIKN